MNTNQMLNDLCQATAKAKNKFMDAARFLNGLTIRNHSDINMCLDSKMHSKPLISLKKKCNKDIPVLPLITLILALALVVSLMCDVFGCCNNKSQEQE